MCECNERNALVISHMSLDESDEMTVGRGKDRYVISKKMSVQINK